MALSKQAKIALGLGAVVVTAGGAWLIFRPKPEPKKNGVKKDLEIVDLDELPPPPPPPGPFGGPSEFEEEGHLPDLPDSGLDEDEDFEGDFDEGLDEEDEGFAP